MSWLVNFWSEVKGYRSRSESESEQGEKFQGLDAKRDELAMGRLKLG